MLAMPLDPIGRGVPRPRERPDRVSVKSGALTPLRAGMASRMLADRDALQVSGIVVGRITVDMVNMMAAGDRPVMLLENDAMQRESAAVDRRRPKVDAVRGTPRIGVTTEGDAAMNNDLGPDSHANMISPQRTESKSTKPRPSTHTG